MKISNTSARLKEIMKERNLRQVDILTSAKPFCEQYGVKLEKNDLSQYVNGKVEPGQEKLTILGLALNVSEAWLMGYDVSASRDRQIPTAPSIDPLPHMKRWPVLGSAACGEPIFKPIEEESVWAPDGVDADFVFRCIGDSMIGAHIFDGDVVFVKQCEVLDGQIGVVRVEDEYTMKRIYHGSDYLELRSENPKYSSIILRGEQLNAEIVGKAVFVLTRVV